MRWQMQRKTDFRRWAEVRLVICGVTLLELVDAVAQQEVVNCKANPRGAQQNNRDNDFPENVDFFGSEQVINAPDGASQTN